MRQEHSKIFISLLLKREENKTKPEINEIRPPVIFSNVFFPEHNKGEKQ